MNSRKTMIIIGALLIAAASISISAFGKSLGCCNAKSDLSQKQEQIVQAAQQDKTQTATVEINDKGFDPVSLKLKAGIPAKVTFVRKTDEGCAKEVLIKEYKINRDLPLNEPVTIEFTPRKGEFTFACAMGMLKGKLIVE